MKLQVEHLAPYLTYGIKMRNETHKALIESKGQQYHDARLNSISREGHLFIGKSESSVHISSMNWKPVLRPLSLSLLQEPITHNGEVINPAEELGQLMAEYDMGYDDHYVLYKGCREDEMDWLTEPYFIVDKLFEWHFDVFGLIEMGLALPFIDKAKS